MSLPQGQCSTGVTQSKPSLARAGKVMESAAHINGHQGKRCQSNTEGKSPGLAECVTVGRDRH